MLFKGGQASGGGQGAQATPAPLVPPPAQAPVIVSGGGSSSPRAIYQALGHQRSELRDQLNDLENQREEIASRLKATPLTEAVIRSGMEQRLAQIDQRIVALDRQIAEADAAVARAAAVPGAVVPTPSPRQSGPPEEFWVISGLILVPSAFILTIAYARRIWRRGAAVVAAIPQEVFDRFNRVDQAIDSMAIEVERIGEGQRYLTRVLADRQLGAGAAQPVEIREREAERQK